MCVAFITRVQKPTIVVGRACLGSVESPPFRAVSKCASDWAGSAPPCVIIISQQKVAGDYAEKAVYELIALTQEEIERQRTGLSTGSLA